MNKYITEFLGTFFLMFAVAFSGDPLAIGLTLSVSIYVGGHISGGHFNPAVSLALLLRKQMRPADFFPYVAAQLLGASFGALLYGIITFKTFIIEPHSSFVSSSIVEVVSMMLLSLVVLSVATAKELQGNYIYGLAIGLTYTAMLYCTREISGGIINPALGVGPWLMSLVIGAKLDSHLVLYLAAPLLGGVLGSIFYSVINEE